MPLQYLSESSDSLCGFLPLKIPQQIPNQEKHVGDCKNCRRRSEWFILGCICQLSRQILFIYTLTVKIYEEY